MIDDGWKDVVVGHSTYEVMVDDHCLVVRPKSLNGIGAPAIWLSGAMIRWLALQGLKILEGLDRPGEVVYSNGCTVEK